jgi:hypothetical protein
MYAIPQLETKTEVLNMLEQIKLTQNKQAIGMYITSIIIFIFI